MGQIGHGKPFHGLNSYTSPYFHSRNGFHTIHSENSPVKPRIVTVVKPGNHPLKKITLLLNRRSVQTFEQLIADISEALGLPRWKNDRVRKLYNLKGKEIRSVCDFFRGDDTFIAMGKDQLTLKCIENVFNELYPDRPLKKNPDHYERLRCKLNENGRIIDSCYEDADLVNKCDTMSPRLKTKHDFKGHIKQKAEETRKTKKQEKIKSDHENLSGNMKKLELCHCKPNKLLTSSMDYGNQCEQCREYTIKQRIYTEMDNTDIPAGNGSLNDKCRKLPIGRCKEERPMIKCTYCHRRCKNKRDYKEVEELRDGSIELYEKTYCPHSSMERHECFKNKCQRERRKWGGKHSNCLTLKHSGRLIEDFLEDRKENIQIKVDRTVTDNESNFKKDIMNKIGKTAEQKVEGGLPRREDEKAVSSTNSPCCIKDYLDIQINYEIGRTIGDGNFAVVKECRFRKTNEEYAMKVIDKAKLIGKEDIIKNEVSIIKMLSHPNIVQLIDDFETDKEIYLILEYIKGGDLFDAITETIKFTEHDAALMMTDLCNALVYIHWKNIVHRDLKPENLLVSPMEMHIGLRLVEMNTFSKTVTML